MPKSPSNPASVDAYIDALSEPSRAIMRRLVTDLRARCPDLHEAISYKMPTFRRTQSHAFLGAYAKHIGLYGLGPVIVPALAAYGNDKGNYSFPLAGHIPEEEIVAAMVEVLLSAEPNWPPRR